MSKWIASGSVVMQTEEYRYRTGGLKSAAAVLDGIELVLTRTPTGAWKLACAQLWSNGESKVIAPSDATVEQAQLMALMAAHTRIGELGQALPRAR